MRSVPLVTARDGTGEGPSLCAFFEKLPICYLHDLGVRLLTLPISGKLTISSAIWCQVQYLYTTAAGYLIANDEHSIAATASKTLRLVWPKISMKLRINLLLEEPLVTLCGHYSKGVFDIATSTESSSPLRLQLSTNWTPISRRRPSNDQNSRFFVIVFTTPIEHFVLFLRLSLIDRNWPSPELICPPANGFISNSQFIYLRGPNPSDWAE